MIDETITDLKNQRIQFLKYRINYYRKVFILSIILLIICLICFTALIVRDYQLKQELDQYKDKTIVGDKETQESFERMKEIPRELELIEFLQGIIILMIMAFTVISIISYLTKKGYSSELKSLNN